MDDLGGSRTGWSRACLLHLVLEEGAASGGGWRDDCCRPCGVRLGVHPVAFMSPPNPLVQRTRDSRFRLHFKRQWPRAADHRRWATEG